MNTKRHLQYKAIKPVIGIVVDASCVGGNPGQVEVQGIDIATGRTVFKHVIGIATNNIGEWLAIAYGAAHIKDNDLKYNLYSDSQVCINWYENRFCKTNIFRDYPQVAAQNKDLIGLLQEADEIVRSCRVNILYWPNKQWGENPADFGRKGKKNRQPILGRTQ